MSLFTLDTLAGEFAGGFGLGLLALAWLAVAWDRHRDRREHPPC